MTHALEVFTVILYCIQTLIILSLIKELEDHTGLTRKRKIKELEKKLNEIKGTEERISKFIETLENNK